MFCDVVLGLGLVRLCEVEFCLLRFGGIGCDFLGLKLAEVLTLSGLENSNSGPHATLLPLL